MKKLLFIPALCWAALSFGQNSKFSFKLGSEYDLPRKTDNLAFFGNEKDGIVNLSIKKDELVIVRFDARTLQKTIEQKIDLPEATRYFNSEKVIDFHNGNYYWVHSDWNGHNELLLYDKIEVGSGKISDANHLLNETGKIAGVNLRTTGLYPYKTIGKYQFDYDADRKKLLVSYRLFPEENPKKNYGRIGFLVFDDHLNRLWNGEFKMPYTDAVMDNADFSVDAGGNAYLLAKVYGSDSRKERDRSTDKPAYHYEVMKFASDSKKMTIATISVDDNYIREATLIENPLHEMMIACTYSKRSRGSGTDGIFLASLDRNGNMIRYKNGRYEFPKEELEKFESAGTRRKIENKKNYQVPDLKVRNVLVESDGGIFIVCEEFNVKQNSSGGYGYFDATGFSYSNNPGVSSNYYNYGNILGSKIDSSGRFQWLRKIPKNQGGPDKHGTLGFKLINDTSGYYFLYVDNRKNFNLAEDEEPAFHSGDLGGQVVVTRLDKQGLLSKDLVLDTRDEQLMIYPADFYRINGNQFIGRAMISPKLFQPILITEKE
jgi:hypothetical protein